MENLSIIPVDSSNWRKVVALRPDKSQEAFIESNDMSLLESVFDTEHNWQCYGLFRKDTAVGFMMIGAENKTDRYIWLDRFMIDRSCQGEGLGGSFLKATIKYISGYFDVDEIVLSITRDNSGAKKFYEKHGFSDTGLIDPEFDEEIFTYKL
ncbi:GNAT family N-acetyltransferase [Salipaludibacillus sp. CUR1]|uniref:GNAT family N-acetyltransferase n=1 Tax=Salipaludibacillus sp. CUR1 TaxID=2820003 RepID=UPI001E65DBA6|nr:GNAT family N-acetyltransferase [Salipaludibacillus sp. CUR1]MCE7792835.1 GNAT family N-acetyltransferase [Salipaludibacillus sp. CUR1]